MEKKTKTNKEKEQISISIKRTAWDKIQKLKVHPNQRIGEIVEDLVDNAFSKKK